MSTENEQGKRSEQPQNEPKKIIGQVFPFVGANFIEFEPREVAAGFEFNIPAIISRSELHWPTSVSRPIIVTAELKMLNRPRFTRLRNMTLQNEGAEHTVFHSGSMSIIKDSVTTFESPLDHFESEFGKTEVVEEAGDKMVSKAPLVLVFKYVPHTSEDRHFLRGNGIKVKIGNSEYYSHYVQGEAHDHQRDPSGIGETFLWKNPLKPESGVVTLLPFSSGVQNSIQISPYSKTT